MSGLNSILMDVKFLSGLVEGEVFQSEGIFLGVTDAPLIWTLKKIRETKHKRLFFEVTYLDVHLAYYMVTIKKGGDVKIEKLEDL